MTGNWSLEVGGVTKTFADWGLSHLTLDYPSWGCDKATFTAPGMAIDAAPLFAYLAQVTISDPSGKIWLIGPISKIPVKGSAKAENQFYTVSGPWFWLEHLVFQMTWLINSQASETLIPTLRSLVIIGLNAADGSKIDLGKMATTIFNYVLRTAASYNPPFVPFQLGKMTPDTEIPFSEVADMTCAQLLTSFFAWVPDAILWFDYSTAPPTLNVGQRGNGTPVTLALGAAPLSSVELNPRHDLVVPAVAVKYSQTNTDDGNPVSEILVDLYPPNAPDPAFFNLVQNVELLGGNTTYQKQTLKTTDRPKDYNAANGTGFNGSANTLAWLTGEHRLHYLRYYRTPAGADPNTIAGAGSPGNATPSDIVTIVDQSKMQVLSVATTYVSNATKIDPITGEIVPAPLKLPTGTVAPGAGPGTGPGGGNVLDYLGQELLEGNVPAWLTSAYNVFSARVMIAITVRYTGDDEVIRNFFGPGPIYIKTFLCPAVVTNGSSQTYKQATGGTPAESAPVGLAKNQYLALSVLHYEGSIELVEQECSGLVGLGNVVNITAATGAGAAWETMNAQVFNITCDVDTGTTRIKLGPPVNLDAKKLTELLRASRGRIQSWHLDQQQTGQLGNDSGTVDGGGATTVPGMIMPHASPPVKPWTILFQHTSSGIQAKVAYDLQKLVSFLYSTEGPPNFLTITGLDNWMPCTIANGFDAWWLKITGGPNGVFAITVGSIGNGNGGDFDPTVTTPWTAKSAFQNNGGTPPQQTFLYVLLGTATADANGNPIYTQVRDKNLQLVNRAKGGEPCIDVENI